MMISNLLPSVNYYRPLSQHVSHLGGYISLLALFLSVFLLANVLLRATDQVFQMDIDERHQAGFIQVNLDIVFEKAPCSLLSLQVQNSLGRHEQIKGMTYLKFTKEKKTVFQENQYMGTDYLQKIKRDIKSKEGCQIRGVFNLDKVQANFHVSAHRHLNDLQKLITQGLIDHFSLQHTILQLKFESNSSMLQQGHPVTNSLEEDDGIGINYIYYLNLIRVVTLDKGKAEEHFQLNYHFAEESLLAVPMVLFKFNLSPVNHIRTIKQKSLLTRLVEGLAVVGGVLMLARVLDSLSHRSLELILMKQRMGKLR